MALEELLEEQIEEHGGAETVGLVFTERRITAMALHNYFLYRSKELDRGKWTRASQVRRESHARDYIIRDFGGQFADATEEVHSSTNIGHRTQPVMRGSEDMDVDQFSDADEDIDFPFIDAGKIVGDAENTDSSTNASQKNGKQVLS